ncbi:MAG: TIGR00730 family Rossman fold protein, partial [Variovorax sp.]
YCGSRQGLDASHTAAAEATGRWIGGQGGQLVYGGGRTGLMGRVAEATRLAGGRVIGVIPKTLVDKEMANTACDELHVVDTMHQRKALMAEQADCFVALAGGIGTLEELFEVWTWRQLAYHDKPIGLVNTGGYFDALLAFLAQSVEVGFMDSWQMELVHVGAAPTGVLETLRARSRSEPSGGQVKDKI